MPSVPIVIPSEMEIVLTSIGVPPASRMPAAAQAASWRWLKLHGIVPIQAWLTPTMGFCRSSWVKPMLRRYERADARESPSYKVWLCLRRSVIGKLRLDAAGWSPIAARDAAIVRMRISRGPWNAANVRMRTSRGPGTPQMCECGPPEADSVPDPAHFRQLIGVEPGRTHPADERLLPVDDPIGGVRKLGRDLSGYEQHAVLVGMEQVAWTNRQSADLHTVADRLQVHVRVRDAGASREEVEAHVSHFLQVANAAVRDGTGGAEGLVNSGLHLTPERAMARRVIEVLYHDNPRRREAAHEGPQGWRMIDALPGSPG